MDTLNRIEHHAYLNTDELPFLRGLFENGASNLTVILNGRTTISKTKSEISEDFGLKKLSHTYLYIDDHKLELNSLEMLNEAIEFYKVKGITNVFITNLVVKWQNGDMHEWKRAVLHVKDRNTMREKPIGRWNGLVMPLGLYEDVKHLQPSYGEDLVQPTLCEIVESKGSKRVCMSIMK